MKTQEELKQIEDQLKKYYKNHPELAKPNMYCKDCGKFLIYDNADIHLNDRKHKNNKHDIVSVGHTFLSTKIYEGNIYHLCRCKECVGKKFPEIYARKFLYAANFAKYTQYAYDIPDEIYNAYTKERQAITKDRMISIYGEQEGPKRWKSYCNKQAITNTFEYKQEKYGMSKDEFIKFNKSRACTLETFIRKCGNEEGKRKWDEYCERQRYTNSLDYFIKEYGEEKGFEKYSNFSIKRATNGALVNSTSKISIEMFNNVYPFFQNNEIFFGLNNEYAFYINDKTYVVDYYDKTLNIIIEFYGDYWHASPLKYMKNDIVRYNNCCRIAKDIWKYDKIRIKTLKKTLNCKIIIVWEHTYKNNKQETINKIINIINNDKTKNIIEL